MDAHEHSTDTSESALDWLCFFNHGRQSGASQPHRHIQMLPLPSNPTSLPMDQSPFQPLKPGVYQLSAYQDLHHAFVYYDTPMWLSLTEDQSVEMLQETYTRLLQSLFSEAQMEADPELRQVSMNLVMTKRWMGVVERLSADAVIKRSDTVCQQETQKEKDTTEFGEQQEEEETKETKEVTLSVNSLGFAGMFLVKTETEVDAIKTWARPLDILRSVCRPKVNSVAKIWHENDVNK